MEKIYNLQRVLSSGYSLERFFRAYLSFDQRKYELESTDLRKKLYNSEKFVKYFSKLDKNEKIAIIGDYDVDGVTGTAILSITLERLGFKTLNVLPNRYTDGYGMNKRHVDVCHKNKCKNIILVDNGIKQFEVIDYAKSHGHNVFILDHHTIEKDENGKEKLPNADVIINPHLDKGDFKTEEICGAMVAFSVCRHLLEEVGYDKVFISKLAVLAAIGTIADVMPLICENRAIVRFLCNSFKRNEVDIDGLNVLVEQLNIKRASFDVEDVSYSIGPALNAPGRLDTAEHALNLLLEKDKNLDKYAKIIVDFNEERKNTTKELKEKAEKALNPKLQCNCVILNDVKEGVVGIIAGKLTEDFDMPMFVFTKTEKGFFKGSGRSPEWFDLIVGATKAISKLNDGDIVSYGGHAGAMGISLSSESAVRRFEYYLDQIVKTTNKVVEDKKYVLFPESLSLKVVKDEIDRFGPFGQGFEEPEFYIQSQVSNVTLMGDIHSRFNATINGEEHQFSFFFNKMEGIHDGDVCDIFFKIKKTTTDTTGKTFYNPYVKAIRKVS